MSNEESKRIMEFIVDQQAQSAAKIGQLEESLAGLANASLKRLEDTDEKIAALVDSQIRTGGIQSHSDAKIAALVDSQIRQAESKAIPTRKIAALVDSQIRQAEPKLTTRNRGRG